jgi:hypothetical protein
MQPGDSGIAKNIGVTVLVLVGIMLGLIVLANAIG